MDSDTTRSPLHVLIAGGGVAGLEALLALHELAGDHVALTLLAPDRDFAYRPTSVTVPFGRGHVERHDLFDVARRTGAELVRGQLAAVDAGRRVAIATDGREHAYDALLVAIGVDAEPAYSRVRTWTPELDQDVFGGLLADLEEGYAKRVAFVVPPHVTWPLPAYELALMTAWDARDMGQDDVEVSVYTSEREPLDVFGADASAALRRDLEEAGVEVVCGASVEEDPAGLVAYPAGARLDGRRVIALPRAVARPVDGLPVDERGFIRADDHGRVAGLVGVWAAGDAVAFPVKQSALAAQQADAAAEWIAAAAGAGVEPRPFRPVLHGLPWRPPTMIAGDYLARYLTPATEGSRS